MVILKQNRAITPLVRNSCGPCRSKRSERCEGVVYTYPQIQICIPCGEWIAARAGDADTLYCGARADTTGGETASVVQATALAAGIDTDSTDGALTIPFRIFQNPSLSRITQ